MNWIAIVVAAASSFALGGLWYSNALFGAAWNREAGRDPKQPDGRHPARVFGAAIAFALVAAVAYAWLVPPPAGATQAAAQGLAVGAGLVAASFGINYQFGGRSTTLLLIDGGYHALQFLVYGLVIGLWR
jgi:hypothetical protein